MKGNGRWIYFACASSLICGFAVANDYANEPTGCDGNGNPTNCVDITTGPMPNYPGTGFCRVWDCPSPDNPVAKAIPNSSGPYESSTVDHTNASCRYKDGIWAPATHTCTSLPPSWTSSSANIDRGVGTCPATGDTGCFEV